MRVAGANRRWLVAVAAVLASILLPGVLLFVATVWIQPPAGEVSAVLEIESGRPFELEYVSDGSEGRVFLDLECDRCSLPVQGELTATAGGRTLTAVEIDTGESTAGTNRESLDEQLLFAIPAQARATVVTVTGTLRVGRERGMVFDERIADAPPPVVQVFRLTVAR